MNEQIDLEGILLIDKPSGMTSHDVVDRVRRTLRMKRVGHAGTLDPMATGLLIMLIGKATKLSQYVMSLDKVYSGTIKLGEATNTYDADGEVMTTKPVPELSDEDVKKFMEQFIGDQYQTPPMFSAIKIKGQPLYKMARKGQEIEREPRFVRISKFELLSFESPTIEFSLSCTKGTYVRSVAQEIGEKIGCGAHLSSLRRDASDEFTTDRAVELDKFMQMTPTEVSKILIPGHKALPGSML